MDELDFSDKPVVYKHSRISAAVTTAQVRESIKRNARPTLSPLRMREIELRLEEKRLQKELNEFYDY